MQPHLFCCILIVTVRIGKFSKHMFVGMQNHFHARTCLGEFNIQFQSLEMIQRCNTAAQMSATGANTPKNK